MKFKTSDMVFVLIIAALALAAIMQCRTCVAHDAPVVVDLECDEDETPPPATEIIADAPPLPTEEVECPKEVKWATVTTPVQVRPQPKPVEPEQLKQPRLTPLQYRARQFVSVTLGIGIVAALITFFVFTMPCEFRFARVAWRYITHGANGSFILCYLLSALCGIGVVCSLLFLFADIDIAIMIAIIEIMLMALAGFHFLMAWANDIHWQ